MNDRLDRIEREQERLAAIVEDHGTRLAITETLHASVEKSVTEIKSTINTMGVKFEASVKEIKDELKWAVRIVLGAILGALMTWMLQGGMISVPGAN